MSGVGIPANGLSNVLMLARPDLAAQQQALQTRRAFAQALLGSGPSPYSGPGGALDTLGSRILGAVETRNSNKQALDLANQQRDAIFGPMTGGSASGDAEQQPSIPLSSIQGSKDIPTTPGRTNSGVQTAPLPPLASLPSGGLSSSSTPGGNAVNASQPPAISQPHVAQSQSLFDMAVPDIPGIDPRSKFVRYASDPTAYMKAYYASIGLTDAEKNTAAAYGRGTPEYNQQMKQLAAKNSLIEFRPGQGGFVNGQFFAMPNAQGITPSMGADGQIHMGIAPGAGDAIRASEYAASMGKAGAKPVTGYDANNMPVATNAATMANGGVDPNAPPQSAMPTQAPFAGSVGQSIVRALFPGATITSGQRSPQHNAAVGGVPDSQHLDDHAVDFVLPQGKSFSDVQQAFAQSGLPASELINEGNHVHWGWGDKPQQGNGPRPLLPELPPGQAKYAEGQAKDAADRHDATVAAAQESPMRINVLDNIINLSKGGVATGPGQEFQNSVLGYAANTPLLSKVMGGAKDRVGQFQELQKFTYQNAIRSWQAAGGTGTDAQMESMAHANPNDHLFPQALQTIAQWGKAGELAVQGKANAQDKFLATNGNTPANQIKFESSWRNAFDPKVFQVSIMSPEEKQHFAQTVLKTPAAAKDFLAKQSLLKDMGAIP